MSSRFKNSLRFFLVTIGIITFTSFTIDATDTFKSSQTALSIFANHLTKQSCPDEMVEVFHNEARFCIDKYEVSPGDSCVYNQPKGVSETAINIGDADCEPVSVDGELPWTFLAQSQAKQLCAKRNMRLPSAGEWFATSLGTPDSSQNCNLNSDLSDTGSMTACVSGAGAYDTVGNVWEFVDEKISNGVYDERLVPSEGFVSLADSNGVALETDMVANSIYNDDYFWSKQEGDYIMMRGGFYGSKERGGIYSIYAEAEPLFASAAVGFRCVLPLK